MKHPKKTILIQFFNINNKSRKLRTITINNNTKTTFLKKKLSY
jgi:hypothetical protein